MGEDTPASDTDAAAMVGAPEAAGVPAVAEPADAPAAIDAQPAPAADAAAAPAASAEAEQPAVAACAPAEATTPSTEAAPAETAPAAATFEASAPAAGEAAPAGAPEAALPRDDAPRAGLYDITFILQPDSIRHSRAFAPHLTLGEVAATLEAELHIPAASLAFALGERALPHGSRLADHGLSEGVPNTLSMSVELAGGAPPSGAAEAAEAAEAAPFVMPDVISVEVSFDDEKPPSVIHVRVERDLPPRGKPFLGGFRHKQSGAEYHHASAQSLPPPRKEPAEPPTERFHRDTQTAVLTTRSQQGVREQGTQMTKPGVAVGSAADDRLLAPLPYFSADEYDSLRLEKVIDLQRFTRAYFARRRAAELVARAARRAEEVRVAEAARRVEAEARHRREIERRMNPRTHDDFETLFTELEAWRLAEVAKLHDPSSGLSAEQRSAASAQLLLREQRLLQAIDKLRTQAAAANKERRVRGALARMAQPKRWQLSDGELVEVHTPHTTRAQELQELYKGLRLPLLSADERLDVLLHVKWTVKEFECNLTRDIVELVDREADLLNRGRSEASLEGLRKRLANLFLQFAHTPEFNPEAAHFQQLQLELAVQQAMGGSGIAA